MENKAILKNKSEVLTYNVEQAGECGVCGKHTYQIHNDFATYICSDECVIVMKTLSKRMKKRGR